MAGIAVGSTVEPVARVQAWLLRAPIERPVVASFGRMTARPCLLVRIEDRGGAFGWGEVWCNFPAAGGGHRLALIEEMLGPWLLGRDPDDPPAVQRQAMAAFRILAIQSGEAGPLAQIVAAFDAALWDLKARRAGVPLAVALGADTVRPMPAYASGINPTEPETTVAIARQGGYRAFKLKLGFPDDARNLAAITDSLRPGEQLMVDVNQGWDGPTAKHRLEELAAWPLKWIEEPVPADEPIELWAELAALAPAPLAGGENVTSAPLFAELTRRRILGYIQPDVAKWGGISVARQIARDALAAGLCYCPHFLGGGVGLLSSGHLLAAVGGPGLLEIDCNPNPLRDELVPPLRIDGEGRAHLPEGPGLGVVPEPHDFARGLAGQVEIH
jgi:L-alanine-DL-glutamate epimerase-like enolase superfamily enzyme